MIGSHAVLRMRSVSSESCRKNQNMHFMFNNFFSKFLPFMKMPKNVIEMDSLNHHCIHKSHPRYIHEDVAVVT
jgi:hypothetical protein